MLFFWQMEGKRWTLDGSSFEGAKKAHGRFCASQAERSNETQARYARAYDFEERQAEAAEQHYRERHDRERTSEVCGAIKARTRDREAERAKREHNPRWGMLGATIIPMLCINHMNVKGQAHVGR